MISPSPPPQWGESRGEGQPGWRPCDERGYEQALVLNLPKDGCKASPMKLTITLDGAATLARLDLDALLARLRIGVERELQADVAAQASPATLVRAPRRAS